MPKRREFLKQSLAAGGALTVAGIPALRAHGAPAPAFGLTRAPRALRILILGGTGFTGPHQVRYAVERGHHVTVFNRGRRQADLPTAVEHLIGDRNTPQAMDAINVEVARGVKWDVVIDNPTTLPVWVRDAGEALRSATDHYIFISTISVYADASRPGMDENTPLLRYEGADPMKETAQTAGQLYGQLKAVSEREAEKWFPGRATIIRPGLIVGPGDTTGRFTYWAARIPKGGEILAPGTGHDPVQFIDARDLAEWTIRTAENRVIGTFNATGPAGELSIAEMLGGIRAAHPGTRATQLTWVPVEFLEENRIRGWSDMPVWVPPSPGNAGFSRASIQRALDAGLTFRPLAETARDTVAWLASLPGQAWYEAMPEAQRARLLGTFTAEREAAALKLWHERNP